jgi:membrane fusion protein, heavy metal efflux system
MTVTRSLVLVALAAALGGCGKSKAPVAPAPAAERNPLAVQASEQLLRELKIAEVATAEVRDALRVPGRIEADEQRVARIGSPVTGRINELEAVVGQEVRRGQTLAQLTSTDLSSAQLNFLQAFSQKLLAERAAQRAQQLFDADVIGAAELQRRQSEQQQAEAGVSAARDQLKVLGMSERAILTLAASRNVNSISTIVAPISGTVIERSATQGQVVQPAVTIFTIADLSNVWLVADVPEQSSELVRVGEQVEAEVTALGGKRLSGRLSFVASIINPETRTVRVRMDLPNADRSLKPAMLATVLIRGRPEMHPVVPSIAVVRLDNKDYVFAQTGPDAFVLRPVTLGPEADGKRRVMSGVKAGEKIVAEGAFQLNIQRERAQTQ